MTSYRARNLLIAVVLAAVAAFLTLFYVTNYKRSVQHSESHVAVLVATKDIPAGTSGSEAVSLKLVSAQQVLRRSVAPGAVSDASQIEKLVATQPTYAGEQVSTRRFSTSNNLGVKAQLKGTMRALQLPGAANQLLAGTLKDGDHVDVVGNFAVDSSGTGASSQNHFDRVVLRNLLVLRAPEIATGTASKLDAGQQAYSVMLAVTDSQASKLWFTAQNAAGGNGGNGWTLQLRPVIKAEDSPENIESIWTVLTDGVRGNVVHKALQGGQR